MRGKEATLCPYEPINGYRVVIINDACAPMALLLTMQLDQVVGRQGQLVPKINKLRPIPAPQPLYK